MRLVFVADDFKVATSVQQLLDRFLIGYPREGGFHSPDCEVILVLSQKNSEVERRMKDFGLQWQAEPVTGDAMLIFSRPTNVTTGSRCFVYGAPLRGVPCIAGTAVRGAWLLPELSAYKGGRLEKGLVIVQGAYPFAEIEALDALLPLIWLPPPKVGSVTRLDGNNFWGVLRRSFWPLIKSAISRSDSPQGDAVRDGRTQDLVGLGLLEGLVKSPRGWLIEHADGFQYVIAVMDGAVADYNVALQTRAGGMLSAQVHRGPPPGEHHYSRLAAMLEPYFRTGVPPWPPEQTMFTAHLLGRFDALQGERSR